MEAEKAEQLSLLQSEKQRVASMEKEKSEQVTLRTEMEKILKQKEDELGVLQIMYEESKQQLNSQLAAINTELKQIQVELSSTVAEKEQLQTQLVTVQDEKKELQAELLISPAFSVYSGPPHVP